MNSVPVSPYVTFDPTPTFGTPVGTPVDAPEPSEGSGGMIIIIIACVCCLLISIGIAVWWFAFRKIDGKWSEWETDDVCYGDCGTGYKTYTRTCTNPKPKNDGKECEADSDGYTDTKDIECETGIECQQQEFTSGDTTGSDEPIDDPVDEIDEPIDEPVVVPEPIEVDWNVTGYTFIENKDSSGNQYDINRYFKKTQTECSEECNKDPRCIAFNASLKPEYNDNNTKGGDKYRCYLKHTLSNPLTRSTGSHFYTRKEKPIKYRRTYENNKCYFIKDDGSWSGWYNTCNDKTEQQILYAPDTKKAHHGTHLSKCYTIKDGIIDCKDAPEWTYDASTKKLKSGSKTFPVLPYPPQ